jgi:tetratricopeptide (TPR) repeat protein
MLKLEELDKMADVAEAAGHCAAAFETFHRIIELDPNNNRAVYRAAKNLIQLGRISDAESYLNQIRRESAPQPWAIDAAFGELRLAQFRLPEAEQHFRKACESGRSSNAPAVFLADFLIRQERLREASDVLLEASLTEKDGLDEVYLNLGIVRRAQGEYSVAREYLLKAIEIDPDYEDAKRVFADIELCLKLKASP